MMNIQTLFQSATGAFGGVWVGWFGSLPGGGWQFPRWWVVGSCSFFLVVQASARFPNLPLIVGLSSATSFRYVKGRAVVVGPLSG